MLRRDVLKNLRCLAMAILVVYSNAGLAAKVACAQSKQLATASSSGSNIKAPSRKFDYRKMELEMNRSLLGKCVGYSFSIMTNGVEVGAGAGGAAQLAVDGANINYTTSTRGEIASCTKLITALSLCNTLESAGISVQDKIGPYLPDLWIFVDESVQELTFEQVLSHRSGLIDPGFGTSDEKLANFIFVLLLGCDPSLEVSEGQYLYDYNNANYRLAAYLQANISAKAWMDTAKNYSDLDELASAIFISMAQANAFVPAGIFPWIEVYDWDSTSEDLRLYNFANQAIGGLPNDDNTDTVGPRGFVMNSAELAAVVSAFNLTLSVSSNVKNKMQASELGIFESLESDGVYYSHNGGNTYSGTRGRETVFVICPGGVVFAVMVNSKNNTYSSLYEVVRAAYQSGVL